ncbi:MAG: class I SAM-dependent rRNA methyltransferase [Desulfurococcales archaeon]|nr:class I SAM-dependent rRNA methyltransferase [Desulfurococcales archaeon]
MSSGRALVRVGGEGYRRVLSGSSIVFRKWVSARGLTVAGSLVDLEGPRGDYVGCGLWEPHGPVAVRVLFRGSCPASDALEAVVSRLELAFRARRAMGFGGESGYRLVNSDGDMLSGLIVDVYNDVAVVQSSSYAFDSLVNSLAPAIAELTGAGHVYEKSTQRSRIDIGLGPRARWLLGGKPRTVIREGDAVFVVDVVRGQKTGFFLDQRLNRLETARLVSGGERVLDAFSYTGGFGIHAALAGASRVFFLEEDPVALELLRENLRLNRVSEYEILPGSFWETINRLEGFFDILVADPPAFIQSDSPEAKRKGAKAYLRAYTGLASKAKPGSIAVLSSCSYFLGRREFVKLVSRSISSAGHEYRMMGSVRGLPPDHSLRGEEYLEYLKTAFLLIE